MKSYDIYLKKPLIEAPLYICSIPYRNGLTITNRVVIKAAIDSFQLHREALIAHELWLSPEVTSMIRVLCNQANSQAILHADVDTLAQRFSKTEGSAMELRIWDMDTFFHGFLPGMTSGALMEASVEERIARPMTAQSGLEILTSLATLGITRNTAISSPGGLEISASVKDTYKQDYEYIEATAYLHTSKPGLFYLTTSGAENTISISSQIIGMDQKYTVGNVHGDILIVAPPPEAFSEKKLTVSTPIVLSPLVAETAIYHRSVWSGIQLDVQAATCMKRYRLLNDVDPFAMDTMDDMTLEELDYIVSE